ncbi:MAG: Shedu immune nuclease family protein [Bacillota bacterium]
MVFSKSYEIIENPPAPMDWDTYNKYLMAKFNSLLTSEGDNEKTFQLFLEQHPCIIPGPFCLLGHSGHYPFGGTVISQPELTGLTNRIPDFMWIACDSGTIYPVLIEIEAPNKPYFTRLGKPSDKLIQALDQLTEWKTWFSNPKHQLLFYDLYRIPESFRWGKSLRPVYLLIYGRRSEFENTRRLSEKRSQLQRDNEFIMSFDRLYPEYSARYLLCSTVKGGEYMAKTIPPTLELGPNLAEYHSMIANKENAAKRNLLLSDERKEFLINRFLYWDEYGKLPQKGLMNTGDTE